MRTVKVWRRMRRKRWSTTSSQPLRIMPRRSSLSVRYKLVPAFPPAPKEQNVCTVQVCAMRTVEVWRRMRRKRWSGISSQPLRIMPTRSSISVRFRLKCSRLIVIAVVQAVGMLRVWACPRILSKGEGYYKLLRLKVTLELKLCSWNFSFRSSYMYARRILLASCSDAVPSHSKTQHTLCERFDKCHATR
jgi:hypothetical protein